MVHHEDATITYLKDVLHFPNYSQSDYVQSKIKEQKNICLLKI